MGRRSTSSLQSNTEPELSVKIKERPGCEGSLLASLVLTRRSEEMAACLTGSICCAVNQENTCHVQAALEVWVLTKAIEK